MSSSTLFQVSGAPFMPKLPSHVSPLQLSLIRRKRRWSTPTTRVFSGKAA
jgi:hypothetical protein